MLYNDTKSLCANARTFLEQISEFSDVMNMAQVQQGQIHLSYANLQIRVLWLGNGLNVGLKI
jgi:hypothetical protein